MLINNIKHQIKDSNSKPKIILVEGWNSIVQKAAVFLKQENIIEPILMLKNKEQLNKEIESLSKVIIDEIDIQHYGSFLYEMRKSKGLSLEDANKFAMMPNYLSALMVKEGKYDGSVCGIEYATKDTLRPALQIVKTSKNASIVNTLMILEKGNDTLLFSDIGMIVDPNFEELAYITENTIRFAVESLNMKNNRVAMLSFSSNGSGNGASVDKVRNAYELVKTRNIFPNENIFGEMQLDAAFDENVRSKKIPSLNWNGKANIYIFPNLDAGNISYKIMQRFAGYDVVGPIVIGLDKPINDLSRGANISEVISLSYITALQFLENRN
ncbi:MAG: phosphotransacetylase [Malacoplasma sp.]